MFHVLPHEKLAALLGYLVTTLAAVYSDDVLFASYENSKAHCSIDLLIVVIVYSAIPF